MKYRITLIIILLCIATLPNILIAEQFNPLPEGAIVQIGLGGMNSHEISPDGTRIAVLTQNKIYIIDALSFEPICEIEIGYSVPTIFTFHPDSKHIITTDFIGDILLWDTDTGERKQTLFKAKDVERLEFNATADTLATVYRGGSTGIWNVETGTERQKLKSEINTNSIFCLAFAPKNYNFLLAIPDKRKAISIYDSVTGELKHTLKGHDSSVSSIAFSPDGRRLASASGDSSVFLWDTETGQKIKEFTDEKQTIYQLVFNFDASLLATTNNKNLIDLWDVNTGEHIRTLSRDIKGIRGIAFNPDFRSLYSFSRDGMFRQWNVFTGENTLSVYYDFNYYNDFSVNPDGSEMVALCNNYYTRFFDLTRNILEHHVDSRAIGGSQFIRMSPDSSILASVQGRKTVVLYNRNRQNAHSIDTEKNAKIKTIEFSADGRTIGVGCEDQSLQLYDVDTGELKHNLKGHEAPVYSLAFSPDGNTVASGGMDSTLRLWDLHTGEMKRVIRTRAKTIRDLDFSPDGKFIAMGVYSKNINVFDVETGKRELYLRRVDANVDHVAYSPDGNSLAIGDIKGGITIIDTQTKKQVHKFQSDISGVRKLQFAMNGKMLISQSGSVFHIWDMTVF